MSTTTGKYVGAVGPSNADIMFVGEAPGKTEAIKGEPFVGRSGRLLSSLMTQAGIHRRLCYLTNVIKERPYRNQINPFINLGKNSYITEKGKPYIEILKKEIEEVNPNVIVAVGGASLFALTGKTGITKQRGSILESTLVPGKKVIPIIHPAAALRAVYLYRRYIAKDLVRVKEESTTPEIDIPHYHLIVSPSYIECVEYLELCKRSNLVAWDIEVKNMEVDCISFSRKPFEAISIPFIHEGNNYFTPEQELKIWLLIGEILENPNINILAHNATFDCSFVFRRYGTYLNKVEDSMVAAGILYPDLPKDLGFLTSIYTKMPYYKDSGKYRNPNVTDREYWIYNAKDSAVLQEIFPQQIEELKSLGNYDTYLHQRKLILPLVFMSERGVKIDTDKLHSKAVEAAVRMAEIEKEIAERVGRELNPGSPAQLMAYFYKDLGLKPYTNKGKPTTDETALKRLSRRGYKVADLVLEYRGLATAKNRYYEMRIDSDNRMRCSFNPVGARTGRLSSSKTIFGSGGNFQNLTPEFKECMMPDENYIAYEIDLSQAENRVVGYIAPEERMIKAFESGEDVHRLTAGMIFSKPPEQVSNEPGTASIGDGSKSERFWGKTSNHAFNYDLGYRSFSLKYEIPEKDGKFIHQRYHQIYAGVRRYHEFVKQELNTNRILTNLFGRKYLFLDRPGDEMYKAGYAYIPQSTVADVINRWGLIKVYYSQKEFKEVELLSQVHDSIIFQISKEYSLSRHVEILRSICTSLEQPLSWKGRSFILPAEVTVFTSNLKEGKEIGTTTQLTNGEVLKVLEEHIYAKQS